MKLFVELHLIDIFDDQTIYMGEVEKMIGSESESAERMRRLRQRQQASLCDGNVQKSDIEIEKEIKKDIDIDLEIERENDSSSVQSTHTDSNDFSTDLSTDEDKIRKHLGGELGKGVVLLSEAQMDDLLEKLSLEEFDYYVGVVADCILKGKQYKRKTHYQAILDMAMADRRVK